ncbi:MAG: dicarboxylate/amino acid:cation symporter [Candidatus Pelethousia sp.]|nr:dicarboxylate/amino acid:cation symporter [Candidatus Pelethousia sp.]
MKDFIKNYRSTLILLGAVALGAVVGVLWGPGAAVLNPFGTLFLNLMLVIIVPLIFTTISLSIAKMQQPKRLGKIMSSIVAAIVITSLVAVLAGVVATAPFELVSPADSEQIRSGLEMAAESEGAEDISFLDRTVSTLTVGDFSALLTRSNLLALIVFSIMIGLAINKAGEKAEPVVKLLDGVSEVLYNFIRFTMYYAPFGLGCYMAGLVGSFGGEIALGYAKTFVVYTVVALLFFFIIYSVYALIAGGRRALSAFWKNVLPAAVTAVATCSSAASIPVNIDSAKKMGVSEDIAETLIPLGTNLHKDGSIIGSVFKVLFLAALFGVNVSSGAGLVQVLLVSLVATLLVMAVPIGGGTISEMMIITLMGFPVAALPILTIIATIIDPAATMLNVVGNTSSALLTARMVDGKDWMDKGTAAIGAE